MVSVKLFLMAVSWKLGLKAEIYVTLFGTVISYLKYLVLFLVLQHISRFIMRMFYICFAGFPLVKMIIHKFSLIKGAFPTPNL
jgi:hypothetical protein